jgi:aspartate/methionine/tyrosine aminotransferase
MIDWESIYKLTNKDTKILLLNSPHNPTGKTMGNSDRLMLEALLKLYPQLSFIMDEVYRELIFNGTEHLDLSHLLARGYLIGSFSKMYPIQGARIGWLLTSEKRQKNIEPLFQNVYGSVSSYGQELAKEILKRDLDFRSLYTYAHKETLRILDQFKLNYIIPKGTFFCFIKLSNDDDQRFTKQLKLQGVSVLPGSVFGDNGKGYIRISFAQESQILEKAIEIIRSLDIKTL